VLQEVAATRSVLILCGSAELEGYAFCSGINRLNLSYKAHLDVQGLIRSAIYLIRGLIFRLKNASSLLNRVCLGELVDMFYNQEATRLHDKVYALLGMSEHILSKAGLSPDYTLYWRFLMERLVKFALTKEASVETWDDKELAVIKTKGYVLGRVSSVKSDNTRHNRQCIEVILGNSPESWTFKKKWGNRWNLQASAKAIQKDDIICLVQGASKPTIIRPCTDHSAVILISVTHSHREQTSGDIEGQEASLSLAGSLCELLLVWDWGKPPVVQPEHSNCRDLVEIDALVPEYSNESHSKAARLFHMGVILGDSEEYVQADRTLQKAIKFYEDAFGEEDLQTIAAVDSVALVYKKQQNRVSAELLLTRAVRTRRKTQGPNHRDTLNSVANLLLLHVESAGPSMTGLKVMVDLAERIRSNAAVSVAATAYIAGFFDNNLMALLLEQRGKDVQITEEVVKAAAGNGQSA
jgi:hypothetical protein